MRERFLFVGQGQVYSYYFKIIVLSNALLLCLVTLPHLHIKFIEKFLWGIFNGEINKFSDGVLTVLDEV